MDLAPTQGVTYRPMDTVVLNGPRDLSVRFVYEDEFGEQQERTFNSGVWPLVTTKLVGFKTWDSQANAWSSTVNDLADLGRNGEFTVCRLAMHKRG